MEGEARTAGRSIALTGDEFRRGPALVARGPEANEIAHRLDVASQTIELRRIDAGSGSAVACADRVDEYQVGDIENRVGVGDELARRRLGHPLRVGKYLLRTERAEVDPYRRRARSTIETEGHRSLRRTRDTFPLIGDIEDGRLRLSLFVGEHQSASRCLEIDPLAIQNDGVMSDGTALLGFNRRTRRIRIVLLDRLLCRQRTQNDECEKKGCGEQVHHAGSEHRDLLSQRPESTDLGSAWNRSSTSDLPVA